MRLLHIAPFYEPAWAFGGMARAASALCRALVARGHDVTVVTARLHPAHASQDALGGVRILRVGGPRPLARRLFPWSPGLTQRLAPLLAQTQLVHLHGHRSGLAVSGERACRRAGVPFVLQPHGTFPEHGQSTVQKRIFDRLAGQRIVAAAAALLAVSEAEARELPREASIVGNGVCMPAVEAASSRGGLLFVGSEAPQKRSRLLPALLRSLPGARLEVIGPVSREWLGRFGAEASRVSLRGVLDQDALARAYAEAALVVHPAVGEAFGLVPFEAALCGTAAVVAGGHGCGEWFGKAGGCVVAPDDAAALAAEVGRRLAEPQRAASEASAVAAFARAKLTWSRAASQVEAVYRAVLERCGRGAA